VAVQAGIAGQHPSDVTWAAPDCEDMRRNRPEIVTLPSLTFKAARRSEPEGALLLHLVNRDEQSLDHVGVVAADLAEARREARQAIRELHANDPRNPDEWLGGASSSRMKEGRSSRSSTPA
jgi:hypothetical protein